MDAPKRRLENLCFCGQGEFQKMTEIHGVRLNVFRHAISKDSKPTRTSCCDRGRHNQVFIIENTNEFDITPDYYLPALDKYEISCPRCRFTVKRAKKYCRRVSSVESKFVRGVCEHCSTDFDRSAQCPCNICKNVINQFFISKLKSDRDERSKELLEKGINVKKESAENNVQQTTLLDTYTKRLPTNQPKEPPQRILQVEELTLPSKNIDLLSNGDFTNVEGQILEKPSKSIIDIRSDTKGSVDIMEYNKERKKRLHFTNQSEFSFISDINSTDNVIIKGALKGSEIWQRLFNEKVRNKNEKDKEDQLKLRTKDLEKEDSKKTEDQNVLETNFGRDEIDLLKGVMEGRKLASEKQLQDPDKVQNTDAGDNFVDTPSTMVHQKNNKDGGNTNTNQGWTKSKKRKSGKRKAHSIQLGKTKGYIGDVNQWKSRANFNESNALMPADYRPKKLSGTRSRRVIRKGIRFTPSAIRPKGKIIEAAVLYIRRVEKEILSKRMKSLSKGVWLKEKSKRNVVSSKNVSGGKDVKKYEPPKLPKIKTRERKERRESTKGKEMEPLYKLFKERPAKPKFVPIKMNILPKGKERLETAKLWELRHDVWTVNVKEKGPLVNKSQEDDKTRNAKGNIPLNKIETGAIKREKKLETKNSMLASKSVKDKLTFDDAGKGKQNTESNKTKISEAAEKHHNFPVLGNDNAVSKSKSSNRLRNKTEQRDKDINKKGKMQLNGQKNIPNNYRQEKSSSSSDSTTLSETKLTQGRKCQIDDVVYIGDVINRSEIPKDRRERKNNEESKKLVFNDNMLQDLEEPPKKTKTSTYKKSRNSAGMNDGVIRYALSDTTFIEKGWTLLPTEKILCKMNIFRMNPAQPGFGRLKNKNSILYYASGGKLAEYKENGHGQCFYKNGRLALDYYDTEDMCAQQRYVIYSSGTPDERGRSRPVTVLGMFDHRGNGVVFDHYGQIRLKYNQSEGVILDRGVGPVSHWKWHTLNDPPVLQRVMVDTNLQKKDPKIIELGKIGTLKTGQNNTEDKKPKQRREGDTANEEMLAIEFENFVRDKHKKSSLKYLPFQIKMKALKINENFSLRVLDQASVYLTFRDEATELRLNMGMILNNKEIIDTEISEIGEVSTSVDKPATNENMAAFQRSIDYAQKFERARSERERHFQPPPPIRIPDNSKFISKPLSRPERRFSSAANENECRCRKPPISMLYYNSR